MRFVIQAPARALIVLITIVVLGSGVYLWLGRRSASLERRVAEIVTGAEA